MSLEAVQDQIGLWYVVVPAAVLVVLLATLSHAARHTKFPFSYLNKVPVAELERSIRAWQFRTIVSSVLFAVFRFERYPVLWRCV